MDDLSRVANEAKSAMRKAGAAAIDKFETWRLEQNLQGLYAKLGAIMYHRISGEPALLKKDTDQQKLTPDMNVDQETAELVSKISRLREEIAVRKDTVNVF